MTETSKLEAQELFEKIKDYDLSKIIERHQREENISLEIATIRATELKRWLVMAKVNPENRYQITGNIDKIWHIFLLFTREYKEFCEKLGAFIHHEPSDTSKIREARSNPILLEELNSKFNNDYGSVLLDYEEIFQEKAPINTWPRLINPYGAHTSPSDTGCQGVACNCRS